MEETHRQRFEVSQERNFSQDISKSFQDPQISWIRFAFLFGIFFYFLGFIGINVQYGIDRSVENIIAFIDVIFFAISNIFLFRYGLTLKFSSFSMNRFCMIGCLFYGFVLFILSFIPNHFSNSDDGDDYTQHSSWRFFWTCIWQFGMVCMSLPGQFNTFTNLLELMNHTKMEASEFSVQCKVRNGSRNDQFSLDACQNPVIVQQNHGEEEEEEEEEEKVQKNTKRMDREKKINSFLQSCHWKLQGMFIPLFVVFIVTCFATFDLFVRVFSKSYIGVIEITILVISFTQLSVFLLCIHKIRNFVDLICLWHQVIVVDSTALDYLDLSFFQVVFSMAIGVLAVFLRQLV